MPEPARLSMDVPLLNKRPSVGDRWVRLATAEELARRLTLHDPRSFPASDHNIAAQLASVNLAEDGYAIAKALEDYESWSCDMAIAEVLDNAISIARELVERAEVEWYARIGPSLPLLPLGTPVALKTWSADWQRIRVEGTIRSVDEARGRYTVACPSLGHLSNEQVKANALGTYGLVVNCEEVEALLEAHGVEDV